MSADSSPDDASIGPENSPPAANTSGQYVVVARRYRPQNFQELVGQQQVSQALHNAIATNRVGHAYLFTGARGVGKTSTARILAKALNCVEGPTSKPCNVCDICQSITSGDDVDVIEIDGASNRGIDEIRQLRSNVNVRPSRARYKIYIIDEVHMLTVPAFNALLKTLEEPPEHVKFFFCTTDPEKIPITVLSRCQRFDFAPVETTDIAARLKHIVESEGGEADDAALQLLARRAAGSMRDSQSLLEQLLAFSRGKITVEEVYRMLGAARGGRLHAIGKALTRRDPATALGELDAALQEGADAGQIANQLLGYFRDMLAASLGCPAEMLLHASPEEHQELAEEGKATGPTTLLALVQLLDQAITRMRQSVHVRTLLEVALVRICHLEELDDLSQMVANLREGLPPAPPAPRATPGGAPASEAPVPKPDPGPQNAPTVAKTAGSGQKKTLEPLETGEIASESAAKPLQISPENAASIWAQALTKIEDTTRDFAAFASGVATSGPNRLVVQFDPSYSYKKEQCERPERRARIEQALEEVCGGPLQLAFQLVEGADRAEKSEKTRQTTPNRRQLMRQTERHPLVSEAIEIFDAEMIRLEPKRPRRGNGDA